MEKNYNPDKKPMAWWVPGFQLFAKLSAWIVIPIIIALLVGNFLDQYFGTKPWLMIGLVTVAFFLSITMIVYFGKKELDVMGKNDQNK